MSYGAQLQPTSRGGIVEPPPPTEERVSLLEMAKLAGLRQSDKRAIVRIDGVLYG